MSILLYMIVAAIGLAILALVGFLWALRSGQFEDPVGSSWRVLEGEDRPKLE